MALPLDSDHGKLGLCRQKNVRVALERATSDFPPAPTLSLLGNGLFPLATRLERPSTGVSWQRHHPSHPPLPPARGNSPRAFINRTSAAPKGVFGKPELCPTSESPGLRISIHGFERVTPEGVGGCNQRRASVGGCAIRCRLFAAFFFFFAFSFLLARTPFQWRNQPHDSSIGSPRTVAESHVPHTCFLGI